MERRCVVQLNRTANNILSLFIIFILILDTPFAFKYMAGEIDKPIVKAVDSTFHIRDDIEAHSKLFYKEEFAERKRRFVLPFYF